MSCQQEILFLKKNHMPMFFCKNKEACDVIDAWKSMKVFCVRNVKLVRTALVQGNMSLTDTFKIIIFSLSIYQFIRNDITTLAVYFVLHGSDRSFLRNVTAESGSLSRVLLSRSYEICVWSKPNDVSLIAWTVCCDTIP